MVVFIMTVSPEKSSTSIQARVFTWSYCTNEYYNSIHFILCFMVGYVQIKNTQFSGRKSYLPKWSSGWCCWKCYKVKGKEETSEFTTTRYINRKANLRCRCYIMPAGSVGGCRVEKNKRVALSLKCLLSQTKELLKL
jgi:hypothetical protein